MININNNSASVKVVNIKQKLSLFSEHWNPKIIGEFNDHKIQAVKLKGPFETSYLSSSTVI